MAAGRMRGGVRQKAKVPSRVRLPFAFSLFPFAFTQPLTPALCPHPMKGEGEEAALRNAGSTPQPKKITRPYTQLLTTLIGAAAHG